MMFVAELPGVLESLQDCNKQLDVVEKGLNDFLDTKKMAFPRCALHKAAVVPVLL
jgi:dynein heavy chain